MLTLTIWQKKKSGHPTRAGQGRLEDPGQETFEAAVDHLLSMVDPSAEPFQIVASLGDSNRGFQLGQGWGPAQIKSELWAGYLSLKRVVG